MSHSNLILDLILDQHDGKARESVNICAIRTIAKLEGLSDSEINAALFQLQREEKVVLYHQDNPEKRTRNVVDGALQCGGSMFHIVYAM